jgi:hypothetical protein
MEMYLFRHDTYLKLHNCSIIDIDSIPLAKRQHPKTGLAIMILALVLEVNFGNYKTIHSFSCSTFHALFRCIGVPTTLVTRLCVTLVRFYVLSG